MLRPGSTQPGVCCPSEWASSKPTDRACPLRPAALMDRGALTTSAEARASPPLRWGNRSDRAETAKPANPGHRRRLLLAGCCFAQDGQIRHRRQLDCAPCERAWSEAGRGFAEGTEVLELMKRMASGCQRGADRRPVAWCAACCRRAVVWPAGPGAQPAARLAGGAIKGRCFPCRAPAGPAPGAVRGPA